MTIAGRIVAPGGTVTATIATPASAVDAGYREDVGIEVTDTARFDLAGITLLRPNDAGLLQGDVLAGGSLNLLANRGFVDVARGADIDIRGTSSAIDVPGAGVAGGFQRRQIASAAGSITLRAPESLSFQGTLHAQGGAGDTPAAGGTATYQLTRQRGFEPVRLTRETYPTAPRTLLVTGDSAGVTSGQNGVGVVDVGLLRASGIDALNLEAGHRIEFYGGADLNLARSLQIAAPIIGVSGDSVSLAAPYVSFGTTLDTSGIAATPPDFRTRAAQCQRRSHRAHRSHRDHRRRERHLRCAQRTAHARLRERGHQHGRTAHRRRPELAFAVDLSDYRHELLDLRLRRSQRSRHVRFARRGRGNSTAVGGRLAQCQRALHRAAHARGRAIRPDHRSMPATT